MGIGANEHRQDNRSLLTAMKTNKTFLALALVSFTCGFPRALIAAPADANALVWAGESREYTSKPGDRFARFTFWFTNVSASEVLITSARGSCSCTKAQLPATPWRIPAGTNSPLEITMDLAGKSGTVTKSVTVESTAGRKVLMVTTTVTPASPQAGSSMNDPERVKNMQAALANRDSWNRPRHTTGRRRSVPSQGRRDRRRTPRA